jgi:hypothetical protein
LLRTSLASMVPVPVKYCRVIRGFICSDSISAQRKSLHAATIFLPVVPR